MQPFMKVLVRRKDKKRRRFEKEETGRSKEHELEKKRSTEEGEGIVMR